MITNDLIARRPSGRVGLAEWYGEVLEARRAAGLSVADLASLLKVTSANIYYWERRLRELGADEPKAGDAKEPTDRTCAGLVRVRAAPSVLPIENMRPPAVLEVRLAGARAIAVPMGFDPDNLRAVVAALEAC